MATQGDLKNFGKLWDKAMVGNNADEISNFIAEDWVIVGTEGGITSKRNFLTSIKSGDLTHDTMESEHIRIKVYGAMGFLTSRGTSGGKYKGQPFNFYEWSTSVFIREQGKWKCVLTMLTPASK